MLPSTRGVTMQIDRLLVSKKELKTLGIRTASSTRLEKAGQFPKRIQLGQCRVAWSYKEVCAWINERIAQRDPANSAENNS